MLNAPILPVLVKPAALDATSVLAALEVSPIFGAALQVERTGKNNAALLSMVGRALTDPDGLWQEVSSRFDDDRTHFDAGVREICKALLESMTTADFAGVAPGLPGGLAPETIRVLSRDPAAAPLLQTAVLLLHEIRAEGGSAAAERLVAALQGEPHR